LVKVSLVVVLWTRTEEERRSSEVVGKRKKREGNSHRLIAVSPVNEEKRER